MVQKLLHQGEAKRPTASGHWLGSEVFHDESEGYYTARFHARTYDGVKVASSYATDEIRLEAQSDGAMRAEVKRLFQQFACLYMSDADL